MVNLFWVQKGEYITKNVKPLLNSNVSKSKKQKRGYWDYSKCAIEHHDAHVIKIALEATQLLYNSHHKYPFHDSWKETAPLTKSGSRGYKPSNMNNPISVWIRSSIRHYRHTVDYGLSLCKEYTFRFDKEHACEKHLKWLKKNEPLVTEEQDEPPPCCMPEQYKVQKSEVSLITSSENNEKLPLSKRRKTDQNITKENDSENSSKILKKIPSIPNSIDDKVIQSYRQYYIGEKLSVRLARWTKREVPDWIPKTHKKKEDEDVDEDEDMIADANVDVDKDVDENVLLQEHIVELEKDIDQQIQKLKKQKRRKSKS